MRIDETSTSGGDSARSRSSRLLDLAKLSAVSLLIVFFAIVFFMPSLAHPPDAYFRTTCRNNLKHLMLALHNYHDKYECFPPAYVADKNGRPMHSWRVLILPELEEQALFDQYDFSQPWDSAANRGVLDRMPEVFHCPAHGHEHGRVRSHFTAYAAVTGPDTIFPGRESITIRDVTDGSSNTIMLVETNRRIPWTAPIDVNILARPEFGDPNGVSSRHQDGNVANVALGDGGVRTMQKMPRETLRKLFLRNDGEEVGDW